MLTKRHLPLLFAIITVPLCAQGLALPPPADAPQQAEMGHMGKCQEVHTGDTVHYTLDIRGTQYTRSVSAELHMRLGRVYVKDVGLPEPDFRNLGGGGAATRDATKGNVYHFTFKVPRDVVGGIYYGAGVYVTVTDSSDPSSTTSVPVTNRTLKHVREFCLVVVGRYGEGHPLVTDFHGGPIERKVADNTAPSASRIYLPTSPTARAYPPIP